MDISAELASAVIAALVAGGGAGGWIERRRTQARAAIPIFRPSYDLSGSVIRLTIKNRLNEDLSITRIDASGLIFTGKHEKVATKAAYANERIYSTAPVDPEWSVAAMAEASFNLSVGAGPKGRIRVTISSSAKTLRNKRFTVLIKRKP